MLEKELKKIQEILSSNLIKADLTFDVKSNSIFVDTDDLYKAEQCLRKCYDCYISSSKLIVYNGSCVTDSNRRILDMTINELENVKKILESSKIKAMVSYNENYKCVDVDNFKNNRDAIECERILSKYYDCDLHDEDDNYWVGVYEVKKSFDDEFIEEDDYEEEELIFNDSSISETLVDRLAESYKNGCLDEFVNDYLEGGGTVDDLKKALYKIGSLSDLNKLNKSVEKYEENSLEPKTIPLKRLTQSQRREIRNVLNKYDNFNGRGHDVTEIMEDLKEIGYSVLLEKTNLWNISVPEEPYKDYTFRFIGYKDYLNIRVYADAKYNIKEYSIYIG